MPAPSNIQSQMKTFRMVYWAMAVGQAVLGAVSYVMVSTGIFGAANYSLALAFQKIAMVFIPGMMATGYFLFRYQLSRIDHRLPLEGRLRRYFGFILLRGAFFEFAFVYCCIAALVTKVLLFLWIAPIVFLVFLLLRPTPEGITSDLQLNSADLVRLMKS